MSKSLMEYISDMQVARIWLETKSEFPDFLEEIKSQISEAIEREFDSLCEDLEGSDEMRTFTLYESGFEYDEIEAVSPEEAISKAKLLFDKSTYFPLSSTTWVEVEARCELTGEKESTSITIDPEEPDCADGKEHDFRSPFSVVGGIRENPGVWGHGGGAIIREVCRHCGIYRETDTWATNMETGEQGLVSVGYEGQDEDSLAWVERLREKENQEKEENGEVDPKGYPWNAKQQKALWKSVQHWLENWENPERATILSAYCECCHWYIREGCRECPVSLHTGQSNCIDTPWVAVATAKEKRQPNLKELMAKEYTFLVELALGERKAK